MDKAIYLLNRTCYREDLIGNLTQKDLEEWVADEDYDGNHTIFKIDANSYETANEAIDAELPFCDIDDYYVFIFGF